MWELQIQLTKGLPMKRSGRKLPLDIVFRTIDTSTQIVKCGLSNAKFCACLCLTSLSGGAKRQKVKYLKMNVPAMSRAPFLIINLILNLLF